MLPPKVPKINQAQISETQVQKNYKAAFDS